MSLSVVAIAYNEAEHIPFWYENHKGLADEFILIDTGSYDDTIEQAKKYGIRTGQVRWTHDFAAAKNAALRYAKSDWILFQSPDFWIAPENFDKIRQAIDTAGDTRGFALPFVLVGEFGSKNVPIVKEVRTANMYKETHVCLFRNNPRLEYRQRVHENIHEAIIENYGKEAIKILSVPRYHHTPERVENNKAKAKYYDFLESLGAIERKIWEYAQHLRKNSYDYEQET